jgi:Flp pilus assembly protein TadB
MERLTRLNRLNAWQLLAALLGLGLGVGFVVWALIWVMWTIRPILTVVVAIGTVGWVLYALRHHRRREEWRGEEWLGS